MFELGPRKIDVWPAGQTVETKGDPNIHVTTFADADSYQADLVAGVLALEKQPGIAKQYYRAAGGTKLHHVERWDFAEAALINARAVALAMQVMGSDTAVVDLSWANIYRAGDYALAHGHTRSTASVVYFLDTGEQDHEDPAGGRFCFVDPRLPCCCQEQPKVMTSPYLPPMNAGTMIAFPSQLVHCVNPYSGNRPRITLAWNINRKPVPGSPLPEMD